LIWQILLYSTPVGLAAIGETLNQRAGQINIGLEGMMLSAAYAATVTTLATGNPWLGLLAGITASMVLALFQAIFTIGFALDQVVVGTAINLLGLGITSSLYRSKFGQSGQLISIPGLPRIGEIDLLVVAMFVLGGLVTLGLWRTKWGLALRATGEKPEAAAASGYSVQGIRFQAALLSGCFAGLAGAHLSLGIAQSFAENMTQGRGFLAIAMVTFGRWKPLWAVAAAVFVGGIDAMQYAAQTYGWKVPFQLFIALPHLGALVLLVFLGKESIAPAALGISYRRTK